MINTPARILLGLLCLVQLNALAQFSPYWTTVFNGQGDFTDRYTCIERDPLGNMVVAGSTVKVGQNRDFLVAKFDVNGALIWRTTYNAIGNGADEVADIAIDNSGNIHVTGLAKGDSTSSDFLTIKLNAQGSVLWAKLFDSPFHLYDQATDIALDAAGNVVVTGQGDRDISPNSNDDILTVKYDAAGNKLWDVSFNGFGNATDRPAQILTDVNNDIYICGRSDNGVDDDMILIKYNSAGVQNYIRYGDRGGTDRGADMIIEPSGNIVIVGRSDNGANDDYYLQKYSNNGILVWEVVYDFVDDDRPIAMALSTNGDLIVTGESDNDPLAPRNWDICTVCFNGSGALTWSQRYNGTAGNDDTPTSLAINATGSVFVTGSTDVDPGLIVNNDAVTLSYGPTGTSNWSAVYSGPGLRDDIGAGVAVSLSGNCMIAGSVQNAQAQFDALLLAYNSSGTPLFDDVFSEAGDNGDNVREIAVNNLGETYIAGYSIGKLADRNFLLMKLLANGDTAWVRTVDGTAPESSDEANDLILDGAGNVIVAGWLVNSGTSSDVFVAKYNSLGDTVWTYRYNNTSSNESDKVYDLQQDANGNIYLTGRTDIDPTILSNDEVLTIKLSPAGIQQWVAIYSNASGNDRGILLQKDPAGDGVYVAGRTSNGTDYDYAFLRYTASGVLSWSHFYNSSRGNDEPVSALIDAQGNFYVCGTVPGTSDTLNDIALIKITATGSQSWLQTFNGTADEADSPESMIFNSAGDLIIAGESDQDPTTVENYDILLLSYSPSGNLQLNQHYDRSNSANDKSDDIAMDAAGHYLILGRSDIGLAPDINDQVYLLALDASGAVLASEIFGGNADSTDAGRNIVVSGNDLFISGSFWNLSTQRDLFVRRCSNSLGINGIADKNNHITLFPNPAQHEISIACSETYDKFEISNILGQIVLSGLMPQNRKIWLNGIPNGPYTLQLSGSAVKPVNASLIISK